MARTPRHLVSPKLLPPELGSVLRRARLFRPLDAARRRGRVVWITGPPGAGKTTLAASWLAERRCRGLWYQLDAADADLGTLVHYFAAAVRRLVGRASGLPRLHTHHAAALAPFAQRFFTAAFAGLPIGSVVVFDNFHELAADGVAADAVIAGLTALPAGMTALVMSRTPPPSACMRLRLAGRLVDLDADALRLTPSETAALVRRRGRGERQSVPREHAARLHARAHGWMAGVVLLLEGSRVGAVVSAASMNDPAEVFAYFAGEVLATLGGGARELLLPTALLPTMTAATAAELSDMADAGSLLAELARAHYFTERRGGALPEYQYHPLFRAFLLTQLERETSPVRLAELRRRAGTILARLGHDEALGLLVAGGDLAQAATLVRERAAALVAEGRMATLEAWLDALPPAVVVADPWLEHWCATVRFARDPAESRALFARAFPRLRAAGDRRGTWSCWCGVVESVLYEMRDFTVLDPWIAAFRVLVADGVGFPDEQVEARVLANALGALQFRAPYEAATMLGWAERAFALLPELADLRLRMFIGYHLTLSFIYGGLPGLATLLLDRLEAAAERDDLTPEARLAWLLAASVQRWHLGSPAAALAAVDEGMQLAAETGLHGFDAQLAANGACAALVIGDQARATLFLARMRSAAGDGGGLQVSHYHFLSGWAAFASGQVEVAARHVATAQALADAAGTPVPRLMNDLARAHVAHARGDDATALAALASARREGKRVGELFTWYRSQLTTAEIALDGGDVAAAVATLAKALHAGRDVGAMRFYWWNGRVMARLAAVALRAGIAVEHVRTIVRATGLVAPAEAQDLEAWPWAVRVRSLGRFELWRKDERFEFTGKAQRRPLELLQAVIALGARAVPEDALADALWPDAEGDQAHQALATTLHRLRQLLGDERAVVLADGKLSLDPERCWLDTWAFERLSDDGAQQAAALDLYRGAFLADERRAVFALSLRERLRARFLRAVGDVAGALEARGCWREAADRWLRALEVDELVETFYQRLMACQAHAGDATQALAVYERCRRVLEAKLGVAPSAATDELHRRIRAGQSGTL